MGFTVRGLTTAACLWTSVSIGLSLGCGYYNPALLATAIVLLTLLFLDRIEKWIPRDWYATLTVISRSSDFSPDNLDNVLAEYTAIIQSTSVSRDSESGKIEISLRVKVHGKPRTYELISSICAIDGVKSASWH